VSEYLGDVQEQQHPLENKLGGFVYIFSNAINFDVNIVNIGQVQNNSIKLQKITRLCLKSNVCLSYLRFIFFSVIPSAMASAMVEQINSSVTIPCKTIIMFFLLFSKNILSDILHTTNTELSFEK
jgi:hypothetical protein